MMLLSILKERYFFPTVSPSIKPLKNPANGISSHSLSMSISPVSIPVLSKKMPPLTTGGISFISNLTMEKNGHRLIYLSATGKSCQSFPMMYPCLRRTKVI